MKKHSVIIQFIIILFFCVWKSEATIIKKENIKKDTTTYYVVATSGLNYREKPRGKVLGKFKALTKVKIVERSGVLDTINKGEYYRIKGEWVGVVSGSNSKKVYVFNGFLSKIKQNTLFNIYPFHAYHIEKERYKGFIPLAELYPFNTAGDVIRKEYLGDTDRKRHHITENYRKMFLFKSGIKETDKVYIYNYLKNIILTYKVKDLDIVAEPSPYGNRKPVVEDDYQIGFSLRGKISEKDTKNYYNSYVYVGTANPFIKGGLKPIIWEKTEVKNFPKESIYFNRLKKTSEKDSIKVFKFTHNNYKYFLQVSRHKGRINQNPLITVTLNNNIVLETGMGGGEGSYPTPLSFKDDKKNQYFEQWTGKLFKNKPAVIFGLTSHSFGCENIEFLNKKEKRVYILCDNRH